MVEPRKGEAFSTPAVGSRGTDIPMVAPGSVGPLATANRMTVQQMAKPTSSWNFVDVDQFHSWNLVVDSACDCLGAGALSLPRPVEGDFFTTGLSNEESAAVLSAAQSEYDAIAASVYTYLTSVISPSNDVARDIFEKFGAVTCCYILLTLLFVRPKFTSGPSVHWFIPVWKRMPF